ncbi:MAG: hypothetical protein WBM87_05145 [Woeseiaceae bacterium]
MPSFYDDNDEFEELSFDDFAATRRIIKDKHRKNEKFGSRKKTHKVHKDRWEASDLNDFDDLDDYSDDEFDKHYRYEE